MDWKANFITGGDELRALLASLRRVAVLGMRPERYAYKAAFYVPESLAQAGIEIVPVPVRDLDVTTILGRPVYHSLAAIPGEIDLVDVFRRSEDIPGHLDDILAKRPPAVWFQSGIRNDQVAEALAREGIKVVQDRCLMVDYRRLAAAPSAR
ncbi:MAG: CoA-binding protein [Kouleothrix sp.]|nr:CoA-binding protein [Kouleothrix sp.]